MQRAEPYVDVHAKMFFVTACVALILICALLQGTASEQVKPYKDELAAG